MKCDVLVGRQRHSAVHGIFNICRRETPKPYLACQLSFPLQYRDFEGETLTDQNFVGETLKERDFAGEKPTNLIQHASFLFLSGERLCRRKTSKLSLVCQLSFPLQKIDFAGERLPSPIHHFLFLYSRKTLQERNSEAMQAFFPFAEERLNITNCCTILSF